jgi:hypothetical protein
MAGINYKARIRYRNQRDKDQGNKCFYCHLRMGDDVTAEHLLSLSSGGLDSLSNIRAVHSKCNAMVGNLPVPDKFLLHWLGKEYGSDEFFKEAKLKLRKWAQEGNKVRSPAEISLEDKKKQALKMWKAENRINVRLGTSLTPKPAILSNRKGPGD